MKRRISILLTFAMICMMLSGCMAEEISINFKEDGSGSLSVAAYYSEEVLTEMGATPEEVFEELEGEPVKKEFNGKPYVGVVEEAEFKNTDELDELMSDPDDGGVGMSATTYNKDGKKLMSLACTIPSDYTLYGYNESGEVVDSGLDIPKDEMSNLLIVNMEVTFPDGVIEVHGLNSDAYKIDDNTVIMNLMSENESKVFYVIGSLGDAETKPGMSNFQSIRTYNNNFTDVAEDSWYARYIKSVYESGIVSGSSDTTYSPDSQLTLAEIITMCSRVHSIYSDAGDAFGVSTDGYWYSPYIIYAYQAGIIEDGSFVNVDNMEDYNRPATRAEMAYVISRCLPVEEYNIKEDLFTFMDVTTDNIYYENINDLLNSGISSGIGDNKFNPDGLVTRAEAATFIDKLIHPETRNVVEIPEMDM